MLVLACEQVTPKR